MATITQASSPVALDAVRPGPITAAPSPDSPHGLRQSRHHLLGATSNRIHRGAVAEEDGEPTCRPRVREPDEPLVVLERHAAKRPLSQLAAGGLGRFDQ